MQTAFQRLLLQTAGKTPLQQGCSFSHDSCLTGWWEELRMNPGFFTLMWKSGVQPTPKNKKKKSKVTKSKTGPIGANINTWKQHMLLFPVSIFDQNIPGKKGSNLDGPKEKVTKEAGNCTGKKNGRTPNQGRPDGNDYDQNKHLSLTCPKVNTNKQVVTFSSLQQGNSKKRLS